RVGRRRFGEAAFVVGVLLGALSLWGAITHTSTTGPNAAFYLPHWRAWEFLAGGAIVAPMISALPRMPRWVADAAGAGGLVCILLPLEFLAARSAYPSYHAVLPVLGASLVILSGLAHPRNVSVRLLSVRPLVVVGMVSYGWYLWHWPILS